MATAVVLLCFALYAAGYLLYSRWLGARVFNLRPRATTPAHALEDGVDYVPSRRGVLFGHHYASITGLSPMLGPAIAVIWGWVPALLWVALGAVLIGCVHDFGSLVVSARAEGKSIGVVAERLMGRRAKALMHALIFFGVALAMGVFVYVIAFLFWPGEADSTAGHYPQAAAPSATIMLLALTVGWLTKRRGLRLGPLAAVAFALTLLTVYLAATTDALTIAVPGAGAEASAAAQRWLGGWKTWAWILLAYAFAASVLPVWSLLQPRDFINALLLYLGLGLAYAGFFVMSPSFPEGSALNLAPAGAPPIFPFVFITIACGAVSGFHSLVASGTTAKQLDRETDARLIGYGAMIGESLLGLLAVLATTAGFAAATSQEQWRLHFSSWQAAEGLGAKMSAFVAGAARFVEELGVPAELATTLVAVVVVSFALTTLDSATRLLRYNIEEIFEGLRLPRALRNRFVSSLFACGAIAFFAFFEVDGRSAGLTLWTLFGATNQLLAGLALLVVAVYLVQRRRPSLPYLVPMAFMMLSTLGALALRLRTFYGAAFTEDGVKGDQLTLALVGSAILLAAVWLVVEAGLTLRRRSGDAQASLDLAPSTGA